jgi:hypothetical protein
MFQNLFSRSRLSCFSPRAGREKSMTLTYVLSSKIIDNFHYLLGISPLIFVVLVVAKAPNLQASLLLSLSLPGAVVWPLVIVLRAFTHPPSDPLTYSLMLPIAFPGCRMLPIIALAQIFKLRISRKSFGPLAYVGSAVIIGFYIMTTFVSRNL